MEDSSAVVALVSDDKSVSTNVFASFGLRNVLIELNTTLTIDGIETGLAWTYTKIASLIDFIGELNTFTLDAILP